jgi:hypothetical protein
MLSTYNSDSRQQFSALDFSILEKTDLLDARGHKDWDFAMGQDDRLAIYLGQSVDEHRRQEALILGLNILAKELHGANSIAWPAQLTLRSLSRQSPFIRPL